MTGEKMSEYHGFCLKCKSYVKIENHQTHTMTNGRKRVAGLCSKNECTGRISKIIG